MFAGASLLVAVVTSVMVGGAPGLTGCLLGLMASLFGVYGLWCLSELLADVAREGSSRMRFWWVSVLVFKLPFIYLMWIFAKNEAWPATQAFSGAITLVYLLAVGWAALR